MTDQQMTTLAIFEDMYRANMRASVSELEDCMTAIELLKRPRNMHDCMTQEVLRHNMRQSIETLEQRLAALRTRFEALPELAAKKSEEVQANG